MTVSNSLLGLRVNNGFKKYTAKVKASESKCTYIEWHWYTARKTGWIEDVMEDEIKQHLNKQANLL